MKNPTQIRDLTKVFQGLQKEARAGQKETSTDVRVHLDRAAADLSSYFEHPDCLPITLGAGGLRYEHAFLEHNRPKPWIDNTLRSILEDFRAARSLNRGLCYQVWAGWMVAIDRAIRNTASVAFLQEGLDNLPSDVIAKSILREVGDMLEGSVQPLVRLRLDMQGVAGMRAAASPPINSMTFGKVIEELSTRTVVDNVYRPQPYGLTVSQWRNIANHNSYEVKGDIVICTYGSANRRQNLRLSIAELYDFALYVNDLSFTHKIAFEIFSVDNMREIAQLSPDIEITDHTSTSTLAYGLSAAGFTVEKVGYGAEADYGSRSWAFVLVDDYNRSEEKAKAALQDAVTTYILLVDAISVAAFVKSGSTVYEFSFQCKIGNKAKTTPQINERARSLDKYYRPIPQEESSNKS